LAKFQDAFKGFCESFLGCRQEPPEGKRLNARILGWEGRPCAENDFFDWAVPAESDIKRGTLYRSGAVRSFMAARQGCWWFEAEKPTRQKVSLMASERMQTQSRVGQKQLFVGALSFGEVMAVDFRGIMCERCSRNCKVNIKVV
jgi:hypothetical protein